MTVYGADGAVEDAPLTDADVFAQENQPGGELVGVNGETAAVSDRTVPDVDTHLDKALAAAEAVASATVSTETAVAVVDEVKDIALAEQWPHDYLMFEGDKLEVRLPAEQALSAFAIGVSKYMPPEVQNDVVGLFIAQHMSPASYTRVFARMMNPDDTEYNNKTIGKLMSQLSKASIAARKAAKAADAADNKD